jgi:hypothetical protein
MNWWDVCTVTVLDVTGPTPSPFRGTPIVVRIPCQEWLAYRLGTWLGALYRRPRYVVMVSCP